MAKTLKELQKEIYARDEKIAKLRMQERELRKKIEGAQKERKSAKDIANLREKFTQKTADVINKKKKQGAANRSLQNRLHTLQDLVSKTPASAQKAALNEIKKAEKEIDEHKAFQHQERQKQEKIYREQKAKMFNSLSRILEDPEGLRDILKPLAAKNNEKKEEGIGSFAKVKAAAQGLAFAASKAGVLIDIIGSREFYALEAQKMIRIATEREEYDPQNPPFFMRLLGDEEARTFLNKQSPKIIYLIEVLAPLITPIVLKELGKIDAIAEEVRDKAKALAALPAKEEELQRLKAEDSEKHRKRIGELEKEITPLKNLQNRERIAKAIAKLKAQGLGDEFITRQLLPIFVETFKELLAKPEDLMDMASAAIDFARASEQIGKKTALQQIFDKIDVARLLQNGKVSEFLQSQGVALTEVITTAMDAIPEVSAKMAEIGINKETVAGVVQAFVPIVGEALKAPDAEVTDRLKEAVADIASGNLEEQKRKAESLEDLARLDKEQGAQKLKIVKLLPELLLKGDIASLALHNIPEFLHKNQAVMEQALPKIWPLFITKIEEGLEESLLLYNPKLDKSAAKKIILPPLELLKVPDADLIQKLVPVVVGFIEGLTNNVSQEDLRALYQNTPLFTSETASPEEKDAAKENLIETVLKLTCSEKMTSAFRTFGEFMSNEKNIPSIITIAKKAAEDIPYLKALELTPSLAGSTVILVATLTKNALVVGDQFTHIARAFLQNRKAAQWSSEWSGSLIAMGSAGLKVITKLKPALEGDLATYLQKNVEDLAKVISSAIPAAKPFATLIPSALELAAHALPIVTDGAIIALSKKDALARIARDFSRYQLLGRQLEEGGLRHEVQLDFRQSRNNLFNSLVTQGLDLVNSKEITNLLMTDIPKFLNDNQATITELAAKAMENPEINQLNTSPELIQAVVPLVIKAAAVLLSNTPGLAKLAKEAHELVTATSKDRPQKVEAVVNSILALKENNKGINDLVEKEIPKLLTTHSEELGKIVDSFLKQTEAGKALRSRGKQIVEVAGKKLPEVKELAERYAKGDRVSLIPKALKLLFNKEVLRLVVNVAGDIARNAWQKSVVWDSERARDSAKMTDILSNSIKIARGTKKDLGQVMTSSAASQHRSSASLEYSMRSADLHAMNLDSAPLDFKGIKVKGFNFNGATFGSCSFESSTITASSFKNVRFNEFVSFKGATIDAESLKTLLPAIEEYNKNHKESSINLDEINIVGRAKALEELNKHHATLLAKAIMKHDLKVIKDKLQASKAVSASGAPDSFAPFAVSNGGTSKVLARGIM